LSLKIQEKEAKDSPYYAQTLSNLSTSYMKQARYTQADSLLALAKGIFEKTGKEHSYYLAYLSNLATTYVSKAKHIQADSLYLAILKIQKKNVGKMHPDYATVLNNLAYSHIYQGKLSQAEAILLEAKAIFEKTKNEEHTIYHTVLTNIGELYRDWGKYKQAEDFFLKAKEMTAKVLGEQHPEYAITLNSLAFLYSLQGKFAQEAPLRLTAIQIAKNTIGEKHPDYATYLSHLAMMYENQGNYAQVDSLYHLVIEIRKNALGENHPDCALDLANLGTYYFNQSNYVKAEALYQKALEIYRNAKNETNRYYLLTLQNLANTYLSQGEYEKSEEILLLILKSTEQSLGKNNDSYAGTLKLLADLYYNQSNYVKVEPMYREALEVLKNIAQEQSPTYLYILSSLANAYSIQKNYTQADSLYVQATQLCKEIYGEKHPEYAQILGMQALFYRKQNLYNKAIPLFEQALAILSKTKGENHADYSNMANQLAIVYDDIYDFDKATPLVLKVAENKLKEIQNNLSNLSESGKQKYLVNKQGFLTNLHGYIAHVLEKNPDYKDLPRLLQTAFTLQLQTKGLLLSETQKVRNRIFASGDSALIRQMELWQAKKNFIAKVYNMPTTERKSKKINLSKLVSEANDLEKNLTTRSADFAAAFNPPAYTYQDIQKKLGENEVAIEMIKGQRTNWEKEKPDTTFYYLALVLTKDDLFPVLMDKGREMDSLHFIEHRRSIGAGTGNYGYAIYWEKIAQAIEKHTQNKIAKVYLAPDGVYHQINLYTLLNPHTQRFLIEDYDLTILTNLKEILESPKQENTTKTAFLLGRPKYLLSKSQHEQVLASLDSQRGKDTETSNIKSAVETAWGELIGTEKEVKFIDSLFHQNQWQTQTYLAEQAVEERVKRVQNPTILHLATHGYFHKTSGRNSQQGMLNSGIVLAGVNTQDKDGSKEDGVLTALEASNLSLDQTELVVLSACETGLGEVAIGEGVYGLQRGFKVAGARSIIMSLWRVNDFVTQKIMQLFYQLWLSGKTKQQAFKEAQKKMKSEYDSPYLWGAFVMVGN
jgi:CHAT domain-containing protein